MISFEFQNVNLTRLYVYKLHVDVGAPPGSGGRVRQLSEA